MSTPGPQPFPVAVKITGEDTWPLAAVREDSEPCRCDECKYRQAPPGSGFAVYCGPDAVTLMIEAAVRDGRYEDISAFLDEAEARVRLASEASWRHVRRTLAPAIRTVGPERVAAWAERGVTA